MSLDIRPITEDEVEQAEFIRAYSFNLTDRRDMASAVERARKFYPLDWSLASFEDGEMTAFIRVIPFAMRINGRGLSFGGVGPVVSLPQHRRKGHVGKLLRQALADMRERGQVLSGLHTPHPTLYRRFGWEIASVHRMYSFAPKDIALMAQPGERGHVRILKPDDWQQADRVYRQHSSQRNGPIHRGDVWWREAVFATQQQQQAATDVALWENGRGEPQGYVTYSQATQYDPDGAEFIVRELVALTTDAYLNLIMYVLRHDLPREIIWVAPPDDPFFSLVDDTRRVTVREEYDMLLRINDVEGALKVRSPAYPNHDIALTIGITDSSAPWNESTYHIEVRDGETNVEQTSTEPDLVLSATTLAPVFNGFLSPTNGALAGLIEARNDEVLAAADALFTTRYPPFCADGF